MYRKWTASGRKSVSNYEDDGVGANIKIDSGGGTRDWAARAWEHGEYLSFKRRFVNNHGEGPLYWGFLLVESATRVAT